MPSPSCSLCDVINPIMAGLADKVVVITGASAGIGAETEVEFARAGSRLVLMARREAKLAVTAANCRKEGLQDSKILVVVGDILSDGDLTRLVDTTVAHFGGIDILVNNAGIPSLATMRTSMVEDMDRMYRIHVRAPYLLIKLALPQLLSRKGNVVNVSSLASVRPTPHLLAYSVAKCAQDQMMKAAALELGKTGVRLNSVCPGTVHTEIFETLGMGKDDTKKELSEQAICHPLKRVGTPTEVAKAIVFLASDDASFVSGVNLPVDGGRYNTSWIPTSRM